MFKNIISVQISVTRSSFLDDCLQSVCAQSQKNWELLLLIDGPSEQEFNKIKAILARYAKHKQIKIYYQEKQGCGKAKVKLFSLTSQKYIIPLDDDDVLAPNAIAVLSAFIQDNPDFSLLRAWRISIDGNFKYDQSSIGQFLLLERVKQQNNIVQQIDARRLKYGLPVVFNPDQFFCLNKVYLDKIHVETKKEFLEMGESLDWIYKLNEIKNELYIDDVLYLKRQHANNCLNLLAQKEIQKLDGYYLLNTLRRRGILEYFDIISNKAILREEYKKRINIQITALPEFMSFAVFCLIIDKAKKYFSIEEIVLVGDCLSHPQFLEFIRYMKRTSGLGLSILSEASYVSKSMIDDLAQLNDKYLDLHLVFTCKNACNCPDIMAKLQYSLKKKLKSKVSILGSQLSSKKRFFKKLKLLSQVIYLDQKNDFFVNYRGELLIGFVPNDDFAILGNIKDSGFESYNSNL